MTRFDKLVTHIVKLADFLFWEKKVRDLVNRYFTTLALSLAFLSGFASLGAGSAEANVVTDRYRQVAKECLEPTFADAKCIYYSHEVPLTPVGTIQEAAAYSVDYWAEKGNAGKESVLDWMAKNITGGSDRYWIEKQAELFFKRLAKRANEKANKENLSDCQRVCLTQCISSRLFETRLNNSETQSGTDDLSGDPWWKIVIMKRSLRESIQDLEGLCVERSKISVELLAAMGVSAQSIYGVRTEEYNSVTGEPIPYPWYNMAARHEVPKVYVGGKAYYFDPSITTSTPNQYCYFSNTDTGPKNMDPEAPQVLEIE